MFGLMRTIPTGISKEEYKRQREEFGRALAAVMDFMQLENSVLMDAEFFQHDSNVAMFKKGRAYLAKEKVDLIPGILTKAYQHEKGERFIPEPVRFFAVKDMVEKGLKLANLDHNALRAGLLFILQTTPEQGSVKHRCKEKGYAENLFYAFIGRPRTLLSSVEKMRTIVGHSQDIFELEQIGKKVLRYMERKSYPKNQFSFVADPTMEEVVKKCQTYGIYHSSHASGKNGISAR